MYPVLAFSEVDSISATLSALPEKNEERGLITRTATGNCVCSVRPEERGARNKRKEDMGEGRGKRSNTLHLSSQFLPVSVVIVFVFLSIFFPFCSSPVSDSLEQAKRRRATLAL